MKNLFNLVIFMACSMVLGLSGCTDDPLSMSEYSASTNTPPKSKLEMALERADEFFAQTRDVTRSSRRVATIHSICAQITRSGDLDTLLYLVNYESNQGFALLGTNPAVNDIYAISATGQLTYDDIMRHPQLIDFLHDAVTYAMIMPDGSSDLVLAPWKYWGYRNKEESQRWISAVAANWHQSDPYNKFSGGGFVGCGPLSIGMFLSYYERPNGLNYNWNNKSPKFNFDWDTIITGDDSSAKINATSKMFAFLAGPYLLNSKMESDSTVSTRIDRFLPTLDSLGGGKIAFPQSSMADSLDKIANFMIHGKVIEKIIDDYKYLITYKSAPIIILGYDTVQNGNNHAWLIDGVITRERCATDSMGRSLFSPPIYSSALPLWHCIWGWEKPKSSDTPQADGWYVYLKDKNIMDSLQYHEKGPFTITGTGLRPTWFVMKPVFSKWKVIGGAYPDTIKIKIK